MNIRIGRQQTNQASAIAVTFMTCIVLGLLMGGYLYMVQGQRQSVARSQSWNQALVVAEAGVDEALALMNSGVIGTNFAVFPWKDASGGSKTSFTNRPTPPQFTNGYYSVTIDTSSTNPVITSTSYVPAPISKSLLSRTVRVRTKTRATFPVKAPMIVRQSFDANGKNVNTDSFDSSLGTYALAPHGTNGDVVSLLTNANSIAVGNGSINGIVRTPPGGTYGSTSDKTAWTGANGKVGDAVWLAGSTPGFQPGHFKDDFTLTDFPDATLPNVTWYSMPGSGTDSGLTYTYYLGGNSGQPFFRVGDPAAPADLSGSIYVSATNTILYVTGSVSISGNASGKKAAPQIHIGPGASLTMYVAGASTSIAGNGIANDTGLAKNFQYYGLPTNTHIDIKGNGAFYGTIYAPQADFTLNGSGNNNDDFTGSSITKTTTMTGNFNFHYDDSLSYLTTLGGYDATSWEEL